jgi:hypothetical protein
VYGVEARATTASTPTVTLANAGGGLFTFDAGDVSVKASGSGAEFHTTSGGTLGPGGSLTLDLIAEVAGSDGTVATDEIDTLITTFPGVSIASSTDSVGFDAQTPAEIKTDCADTLGALSPDGPADALEYVVRQKKFTGVETITRSRATEDDDTGRSTVYVAGPSGAVDGASVIAAQAAIETWASPLCFRGTATNATEVTIPVTAVLHGDDLPADYVAQSTSALQTLFAAFPIADDSGGEVPTSEIIGTLTDLLRDWGVSPARRKVVLSAPAATIAYAEGEVPKLGVVTITSV